MTLAPWPETGTSEPNLTPEQSEAAGLDRPGPSTSWSNTGVAPKPARCIHDLVADQAQRSPNAIAVSCGTERLTYAELDVGAARLAAHLVGYGVGPDRIVALQAERSPQLILGLLAILKAGGAYLALEPDAPPDRINQLLTDAEPALLLGDTASLNRSRAARIATVDLGCALTRTVDTALPPATTPDGLAYVSYTSGSTGEPKGVCVPHRAVARLVQQPDWAQFTSDDVFLQLAPVAFDASTLEIWAPLTHGARLAIQPPGRITSDTLAETLNAEKVSVLWLTAGFFHQMVDARLDAFAGLRHVLSGGDVLSRDHVSRLLRAHPHLNFTNGYGPTENTTFTTCWTVHGPIHGEGPVPIGRPINGTGVAILDANGQPVPVGVAGELHAFGDGLAHGYLRRPEATAERFIHFAGPEGRLTRMYRTGDLACWRPDGTIDFLGRVDQQVKIQGYRVEPGAVEAALTGHSSVRDAVVVARSDGAGGQRLLAYIVPDSPVESDPQLARRLRERLREQLPVYMVPQSIVVLPKLPLGPTGKIDKAALPDPSHAPRTSAIPYRAPETPMEEEITNLWSNLLGVAPIGADDDFFELGGHSLLAARALHMLRRAHGVKLTYFDLLDNPTVAGLAITVERSRTHQ